MVTNTIGKGCFVPIQRFWTFGWAPILCLKTIRWQHLTIVVVNTIGRGCVGAHPKVSDQTSELFELPPPPSRCSFPLSGIGHDYLESSRLSLASDISCPCQVSGPLSWSWSRSRWSRIYSDCHVWSTQQIYSLPLITEDLMEKHLRPTLAWWDLGSANFDCFSQVSESFDIW